MPAYFIERLTAPAWLLRVRPRLQRDGAFSGTGPVVLWFVEASTAGLALARRAAAGTAVRVELFDFDAATMHDEQGKLIWLRIYYEDMARALDAICAHPAFAGEAAGRSRYLVQYLRKQILPGPQVTQPYGLWRALYLLHACVWRARRDGLGNPAAVFMTARAWMRAFIEHAYADTGVEVVACGRQPVLLLVLARLLRHDLRAWGGRLARLLRADWRALGAGPAVAPGAAPCVALQYYGQFNLEQPRLHSDFFFWQCSGLPGRNLLALFNLPQDPLDAGRERQLSAEGIRAIALSYAATTLPSDRVCAPVALARTGAKAAAVVLGRAAPEEEWWLRAETRLFERRREYWRSVFRAQKARVFATWFKYDAEHCAIAAALEELDGALAVYQRSFEGNALVQGALACDVYFAFSAGAAATEAAAGSSIRHGVVTGYLGDHRFAAAREQAAPLRQALQAQGARYVAAYFDENSGDDARWILGHERERRHYAFFLQRVLEEPHLGLVLKPKSPRTLRARLGSTAALLESALATGRCHLFGEGVLQAAVPPVQAALSADLVIHSSIAAATAGVEATLAGARVALLDDDGWSISPLNALGRGRVIFEQAEVLWQAWARDREGGGVPGFADWSGMLDALDPFRDGRAAERMGDYLHWLIQGFEAGRGKVQVLAEAAERYARAWGRDKIFSVGAAA